MEVNPSVFEGDPCVTAPSFLLVGGEHEASLQQASGGLFKAAEVLGL